VPRVKRGPKRKNRREKILKLASGFYGGKSRLHRSAKEAVDRAGNFAYRDRRARRRHFRRLWIVRINAGARQHGLSYSRFMAGLRMSGIDLDRKVLADIAYSDPEGFARLAEISGKALS
jgi:large subunit ribosomal protein L20